MKSFDKAYKTSRQRTINEQQKVFAVDKAKLIAAVKKEYGIQDFNALSEKEKAEYKSVINEMWSKDSGLNENGLRFLMEGSMPLTEKSSDEKIESWFKREIREDLDNVIMHLVSKGECECVVKLKNQIEKSIGKKVKISLIRKWLGEVICKYIASKVNSLKFSNDPVNEGLFGFGENKEREQKLKDIERKLKEHFKGHDTVSVNASYKGKSLKYICFHMKDGIGTTDAVNAAKKFGLKSDSSKKSGKDLYLFYTID